MVKKNFGKSWLRLISKEDMYAVIDTLARFEMEKAAQQTKDSQKPVQKKELYISPEVLNDVKKRALLAEIKKRKAAYFRNKRNLEISQRSSHSR